MECEKGITRRLFLENLLKGMTALAVPVGCSMRYPRTQSSFSIEEKVGQMVMGGFRGFSALPGTPVAHDITKMGMGGVVLYDYDVPTHTPRRNIRSPLQLEDLNGELQSLAAIPLLIAMDEEGGRINRLKPRYGFPPTVSAHDLGQRDDVTYTYDRALEIARTLKGGGINLNFAPVVDLNVNPENPVIGKLKRSFSADPAVVVRQALAFIRAHHAMGIACTLKHFPGHGSSTQDSHLGFVDVTKTWTPKELLPYREIIDRGMADAIMTAHVFNRRLDPRYPATLSKRIITGLLREKLNYDGVVISDDMQMDAIRKFFGFEQALYLAVNAGIDIILIANNTIYDPTAIPRAVETVSRFVHEGKISPKRIDISYRRIMKLKRRYAYPQVEKSSVLPNVSIGAG